MTALRFLDLDGQDEVFRCRVYGAENDTERQAFMRRLAGDGVLEAPAFDGWLDALDARGWATWTAEPVPGGHVRRWRLTEMGRREWAAIGGGR
jgi:hypothetical protein